jgi:putative ABC transport system ATP-binding protein
MATQQHSPSLFERPATTVSSPTMSKNGRTPLVSLTNLSKSFREGRDTRQVLYDITFDFYEGEFTLLLGHSGSGKSTLLNLISGIEEPDGSRITIYDIPISHFSERERTLFRRDQIGFIFQFFNLISTMTVLENITLPQELAGKRRQDVETAAMRLLERVGLADRCDTFPDKLSGGEQQARPSRPSCTATAASARRGRSRATPLTTTPSCSRQQRAR